MADQNTRKSPLAHQRSTHVNGIKPLLDLDTMAERRIVRIDGKPYELRMSDELSLVEWKRFRKDGQRLDDLWTKERDTSLTEPEAEEVGHIVNRVTRMVLMAPSAVQDRLTPLQRLAVVETFTLLRLGLLQTTEATRPGRPTAKSRSGKTSSRN